MKNDSSSFFSTGEFATLCGTTKDTLFHYDELGLLKPVHIKDNGYRYYSLEQIYLFDLIRVLKNSGCALIEIKDYLTNQDEHYFHQFINDKKNALLIEKANLERSLNFLDSALEVTDSALNAQIGIPQLKEFDSDGYLIVSPCSPDGRLSKRQTGEMLHAHFSYCENELNINKFPLGYIVLKETLFSGELYSAYVFSQIPEPVESVRLFTRPKGKYVSIHHRGSYETIGYAYQHLFDYIEEHHLHICGHAYEFEIMSYLVTKVKENFIIEVMIQVG